MTVKEQIVVAIHTGLQHISTALFYGQLDEAIGFKNYVEGFISCAEVANIIESAEAQSFRQAVQRVAKGGRPPVMDSWAG
jgi:hypothetical protein